jgi:hypothetical protein
MDTFNIHKINENGESNSSSNNSEEYYILGYNALWSVESQPIFGALESTQPLTETSTRNLSGG